MLGDNLVYLECLECRYTQYIQCGNAEGIKQFLTLTSCLIRSAWKCRSSVFAFIRSACKCRSSVFAFLILFFFFSFFFFFFFLANGALKTYPKTGCSESDQTWQSGRSP